MNMNLIMSHHQTHRLNILHLGHFVTVDNLSDSLDDILRSHSVIFIQN